MDSVALIEQLGRLVDVVGVGLIVAGAALAVITTLRDIWRWPRPDDLYRRLRQRLGRAILIGLEVLIAADIIRTVAITPTLDSVLVLGGIVLVRIVLSVSLEMELEGRWPWQRRST
jgi:uncharacterized membrane protein